MKTQRLCNYLGIFSIIILLETSVLFWVMPDFSVFIQERELAVPFEKAVELLPQQFLKTGKWTVRSVPCGLPEQTAGNRIMVFELCAREYAVEILSDPSSRMNAAVLPCKVAIYERDGKTWMSRLEPKLLKQTRGKNAEIVFLKKILPEQERLMQCLFRNDAP